MLCNLFHIICESSFLYSFVGVMGVFFFLDSFLGGGGDRISCIPGSKQDLKFLVSPCL